MARYGGGGIKGAAADRLGARLAANRAAVQGSARPAHGIQQKAHQRTWIGSGQSMHECHPRDDDACMHATVSQMLLHKLFANGPVRILGRHLGRCAPDLRLTDG